MAKVGKQARAAELEARRALVQSANRRFGRGLSIAGAIAAGLALLGLVSGGLLTDAAARARHAGAPVAALEGLRTPAASFEVIGTALLGMLALVLLLIGEQLRRGAIYRNADLGQRGLPTASYGSRFTPISLRWHGLWAGVGAIVSLLLIGIPGQSFFTHAWPRTGPYGDDFGAIWIIYGAIGLPFLSPARR